MSFSSHKRKALDATQSMGHRMSHLRSCAMLVGQKHNVPRSTIMERVAELCGVDIATDASEAEILSAVHVLEGLRMADWTLKQDLT